MTVLPYHRPIVFIILIFKSIVVIAQANSDPILTCAFDIKVSIKNPTDTIPVGPSGLIIKYNALYFVSDNHNNQIFKWEIDTLDTVASFQSLKFSLDEQEKGRLSFEGITIYNNDFYLISEDKARILKVGTDLKSTWIKNRISNPLVSSKYKYDSNAQFEGIAIKDLDHVYLAAERNDRGIVSVKGLDKMEAINDSYWLLDKTQTVRKDTFAGDDDISDIVLFRNKYFVLERKYSRISQISMTPTGARILRSWDFSDTAHNHEYSKKGEQPHGVAEGLCMDDQYIYVIFDNATGYQRLNDKMGNSPRLLIFKLPAEI